MGRLQQAQSRHQGPPSRDKAKKRAGAGPRLPASLRRELSAGRPNPEAGAEAGLSSADVYEYEENDAPEEAQKNHRYDDVDRLEYELPSDFEDEEIDEEAADGGGFEGQNGIKSGTKRAGRYSSHYSDDEDEDEEEEEEENEEEYEDDVGQEEKEAVSNDDAAARIGAMPDEGPSSEQHEEESGSETDDTADDGRHQRMIEAVKQTVHHGKKKKHAPLLSEAYPESEFNINPPTEGHRSEQITVEDLMSSLQGTTGFGSLRKRMQQLQRKAVVVDAPLPKVVQEKINRRAGYEKTSEEISKWQDIVKRNREAPTLVLTRRSNLTPESTAELAAKFEPSTDLEKEVALLLQEAGVADGPGGDSLGFNMLTVDEVKERQQRLAKMRNVLFYHEAKAKRMKKIKSKTFHRLLQKDQKNKSGLNGVEDEFDPAAMQEAALKAEYKRAQERMTLKHRNTSRWAKRIIKRGLKAKDDGSREAIAEQLCAHTALTRKIHSANNVSSSEESSDDEGSDSSPEELDKENSLRKKPRLLAKAKVETLKVLEGDAEAEIPTSGLFALPFMARAIEKKRKQAQNEALAMLEQLEHLDNGGGDLFNEENDDTDQNVGPMPRRLGFGEMANQLSENGKVTEVEPDMLVEEDSSEDDRPAEKMVERSISIKKSKARTNGDSKKTDLKRKKMLTGLPQVTDRNNVTEDAGGSPTSVQREAYEINNPWLFGDVNGNFKSVDDSKLHDASKDSKSTKGKQDSGRQNLSMDHQTPLITSVNSEEVTIAGSKSIKKACGVADEGNVVQKTEKPQSTKSSGDNLTELPNVSRAVSSSDSEDMSESDIVKDKGLEPLTGNESQAELIQRAFAGDNVEAEFEQLKSQVLDEEAPMGEASLSLPGWGQWTEVQKKKGQPLWLIKEQEELKRKRQLAMGKRKDSKLKHVILSEKLDKKAEKFASTSLPFPYNSRETYERSIRMPIGREFNTDEAFRDMIRPSVVKDIGRIIDPIKYTMSNSKHGDSTVLPKEEKKKGGKKRHDIPFEQKEAGIAKFTKLRKVAAGV